MKFSLVAVASLALAGMASAAPAINCSKTVTAVQTTTCDAFAKAQGIAPEVFATVNKIVDLDQACTINAGDKVCVEAPKTKAKRCLAEKKGSSSSSSSDEEAAPAADAASTEADSKPASNSGAPSEYALSKEQVESQGLKLVNKINPNCKWFYTITPDDVACEDVSAKNNIDQATLFKLNKNLHSKAPNTCDNLDTGKTYCVGL
ncbi:hypothetical protein O0I10_000698 [Lichtheimia ornata]|uniref:LysM domain-containing protein n=1 Tax=Lichtheimia ornata TaxID=688661 RepID=A0AAD7Y445_9FUNG|nr:uncharacterized protein O0I10_000698 [Lichtheimia ornata]KAJ8663458.1 hypothetical protein O0I10_000698 [Lichtheimia ornata]